MKALLLIMLMAAASSYAASNCSYKCDPPDWQGCVTCRYLYPCGGGVKCCPTWNGGTQCREF